MATDEPLTLTEQDFIGPEKLEGATVDDPLARLVALDKERRKLEDRLEAIKKERPPLEEILLEQWADRGQQNANVNGMTVYIAHDFFCTKKGEASTEQLLEVLKATGLERVIQLGYNASGLKAWVKEQLAAGSDIPEQLAGLLNYDTVPRLKTRLA